MARKTVGYTRMVWTCPNCGTRNQGNRRLCTGCGAQQPKDVAFEQASQEELITDAQEIEKARAGADIHCPYCGTRNPAGATTCSQCHGDLKEGTRRQSGHVVGKFRSQPAPTIKCPACGTINDTDSPKCIQCGAPLGRKKTIEPSKPAAGFSPKARLFLIALLIVSVIGLFLFFSRCSATKAVVGRVNSVRWERSIAVEEYQTLNLSDWWDEIPDDAIVQGCDERYRYSSSEPVENAREVCGEPYSVDQGSGYAEVVQDCEYQVFEPFCDYQVEGWAPGQVLRLQGSSLTAQWPSTNESSSQRLGKSSESYVVLFATEDGIKQFDTDDYKIFQVFEPGSEWELILNGFGNIEDINPY
jgi:ribosomal protein L40E